jgi:uncharacterized membrane protein YsdA (DUF1294 family)
MWSWIIGWYILNSIATFLMFGIDKWKSIRGRRRLRESTLHLLEALGGWPGALVAMQLFRHKRSKKAYMRIYWLIVLAHLIAWAAWWIRLR